MSYNYKREKYQYKIAQLGSAKLVPTPTINTAIIKRVKDQLDKIPNYLDLDKTILMTDDSILKACYTIVREVIVSFGLDGSRVSLDDLIDKLILVLNEVYVINPKENKELFTTNQKLLETSLDNTSNYPGSDNKHKQELYVAGFQVLAGINYILMKYQYGINSRGKGKVNNGSTK